MIVIILLVNQVNFSLHICSRQKQTSFSSKEIFYAVIKIKKSIFLNELQYNLDEVKK